MGVKAEMITHESETGSEYMATSGVSCQSEKNTVVSFEGGI